jgi:pimeloyl-ACP methyl ester carboxylesterase
MSDEIRPFRVDVPEAVLTDLRERLARTRWPDQIPGSEWGYGTEITTLQRLCEYWRTSFDWRAAEARLNAFPQFTTTIDGQNIHFLHVRSPHEGALPLLVTHGWPGSVWEFMRIIEPLTDPTRFGGRAEDAFHVVAPSLPGYGFSGPTTEPGWDPYRVAETWATLMARLGYGRYGAQGGDWGAIVTSNLGTIDPDHLVGIHVNMVIARPPDAANPTDGVQPDEIEGMQAIASFQEHETGYQQIQGTKPQTLSYGLNDSPAGLAGWILEKFRTWSDCDGDVFSVHSMDDLLANISIYWVTGTIGSSVRIYCENRRAQRFGPFATPVTVPTGAAIFPKELYRPPLAWAKHSYNITHWQRYDRGGHFAAMERPDDLVADVRTFFATVR